MSDDGWRNRSACQDMAYLFTGGHACAEDCPDRGCRKLDNRTAENRMRNDICKQVCDECPVLEECRAWVLSIPEPVYGVVGGLTEDERRRWNWRGSDTTAASS